MGTSWYDFLHFHRHKMSGRRETVYQGQNQQGNEYRVYNDGGYTYKNYDNQGQTQGRYFDTGNGAKFYRSSNRSADEGGNYRFYENRNGERSYQYKNTK